MRVKLSSGVSLNVLPVSGVVVQRIQGTILDPAVPRFFIEDQNRWVENPSHPEYLEGLQRAAQERAEATLRVILEEGIRLSKGLPDNDQWLRVLLRYEYEDPFIQSIDLDDERELELLYIIREGIQDAKDVALIVQSACLTEPSVQEAVSLIGVVKDGLPIETVPLRYGLDTGVGTRQISAGGLILIHPSEEYSACTASGLSWWKWRHMKYELSFMIETIAHCRVRRMMDSQTEDARQADAERKARNAKNKGKGL